MPPSTTSKSIPGHLRLEIILVTGPDSLLPVGIQIFVNVHGFIQKTQKKTLKNPKKRKFIEKFLNLNKAYIISITSTPLLTQHNSN